MFCLGLQLRAAATTQLLVHLASHRDCLSSFVHHSTPVRYCLQVSEKILLLDAEAKELRLAAAAADDRAEVLAREKVQVMGLAEELRADVAAKMALLDEFEARFARQYRYAALK